MVKADLVRRMMEATTLESPAALEAVDTLFESVSSALARGGRVVFRGLPHQPPQDGQGAESAHWRAGGHPSRTGGAFPSRAGSRQRP